LQKAVALLKTLAISLRNVDLQPLRPFGLRVVDASVMLDPVGGNINAPAIDDRGEGCGPHPLPSAIGTSHCRCAHRK